MDNINLAIEIEPQNPYWYVDKAFIQIYLGELSNAAATLDLVLDEETGLDPLSVNAMIARAWLENIWGDYDGANDLVNRACAIEVSVATDTVRKYSFFLEDYDRNFECGVQ